MFFSTIPSTILWREDVILIEVRDAIKDYKPVADMQEILAIEFAELCKEPVEAETH
jgi:hypothetical protein